MKKSIILIFVILISISGAVAEAAQSGPGTSGDTHITQTISLEPGWNSVSFKVSGVSFTEDIKPQCSFNWYNQQLAEGTSVEDIADQNKYYVWSQKGGSWSHPDELETSRGYSLNVNSECDLEVAGTRERIDNFELEDGWNLVNVPSGLAFAQIKNECSLRWYNQDLDAGASVSEISEDERRYYWVNDGGSWRDPHRQDDHRGDDGVYINSNGACQIDSWPYDGEDSDTGSENQDRSGETDSSDDFIHGDLYFWDTEAETDLVNSEAGSDENAELSYNMYDGDIEGQFRWDNENNKEYTLWMKNEQTGESAVIKREDEAINFPVYSQTFEVNSVYDLYMLSDEGCTDFRIAVLPADWNGEDSDVSSQAYQDSIFTFCPYSNNEDADSDDQCNPGYTWSSWTEECIEINEDIEDGLDQIENTKWSVTAEDNTIHTLDDISLSSSSGSDEIMIHTGYKDGELADHGQTGWCGNMYFETSSLELGLATFTIEMEELENTRFGAEQDTQTPYIMVDGEPIFEKDDGFISPGDSHEVSVELQSGENVKIGLEERDLVCGGYNKRTKAVIEVDDGNIPDGYRP